MNDQLTKKANDVLTILNDGKFDLVDCHSVEGGWEYRWYATWDSPPYKTRFIANDALENLSWPMAVLLLQNS